MMTTLRREVEGEQDGDASFDSRNCASSFARVDLPEDG